MTEPTYGGYTRQQLMIAAFECGAGEMVIAPRVVVELLTAIERDRIVIEGLSKDITRLVFEQQAKPGAS